MNLQWEANIEYGPELPQWQAQGHVQAQVILCAEILINLRKTVVKEINLVILLREPTKETLEVKESSFFRNWRLLCSLF